MELGILDIGLDIKVISPALLSMMVVMALSSAARTLASPSANRRWPNEIGRRGFDRLVPVRHPSIRTEQSGRRDSDNSSLVQPTNLRGQIAASNKREEYAWESI
jgi:hypothetical protein